MTRFVFVTGGVVSSLGKGIAAASLGAILESRGLKVTLLKLDPYINVDPGTMSPFQHGEVFVTEDGAETDLDLGHYERFVNVKMHRGNNFTAGQIYESVIKKERKGEYLGKTVQVVPHITEEIQQFIHQGVTSSSNFPVDVAIIEIGGTVGDIESLPFLEAVRQMSLKLGQGYFCFIHLTLVPFIAAAGELKTKPTQHSVQKLREIGIFPHALLCRADRSIPDDDLEKISLFSNINKDAVFSLPDVDCIYKIPLILNQQGLDSLVCKCLNLEPNFAQLHEWESLLKSLDNPQNIVKIGIVGKYVDFTESYKSLIEALKHAAMQTASKLLIEYIDSEIIESGKCDLLFDVDGLLVPGGFGRRGIEGKIHAIKHARELKVPFLGICLGMQLAVIEFARTVVGLENANSTEFDLTTPFPVVGLLSEWTDNNGLLIQRDQTLGFGGTMRLGAQRCPVAIGTNAENIYGAWVNERHRHRYEVNGLYLNKLCKKGMIVSATTLIGNLPEIIELPVAMHPWFMGVQFHPEFTSTPRAGHPLFISFLKAAIAYRKQK